MLVLVCGMHRSGSTLVWQITRQLLDGTPGLRNPRGVPSSEFPAAAANPDEVLLAKIHYRHGLPDEEFPDAGAMYLYTYRDLRDVVASLFRKGRLKPDSPRRGVDASRSIARREVKGDAFWRQRRSLWTGRYEEIHSDLPALVRSLARFLSIEVTDERVAQIAESVTLEQQQQRVWQWRQEGVNPDLRVTANHITDGREGAWRDTLTPEELKAIEGVGARWLVEHGYDVETEVARRKTADLRGVEVPARAPAARRRSREQWTVPLLLLAAVCGVLGVIATFAAPALSLVPWVLAVGAGVVGGYLWGREGHALLPRRRR